MCVQALTADPNYKLIARAYPYMARRLLTDPAPELRWVDWGGGGAAAAAALSDALYHLGRHARGTLPAMRNACMRMPRLPIPPTHRATH